MGKQPDEMSCKKAGLQKATMNEGVVWRATMNEGVVWRAMMNEGVVWRATESGKHRSPVVQTQTCCKRCSR